MTIDGPRGPGRPQGHTPRGGSPWPAPEPGWVEVLRAPSRAALRDAALVLASAGIEHAVEADGRGARILTRADVAARALDELADYSEENVGWPPVQPPPPRRTDGVRGAAFFVFAVVLMHALAQMDTGELDWSGHGRMVAALVRAGELERTVTALTLHVDLQHLLSNITFGVLFGVLTAHVLGGGLTWLLAVLAGALGNLANAWIQDPSHRSIGASTAVFGLLGLLATYEWARRHALHQPPLRRLAPLFGGAVLLGWLGVGDTSGANRVDVLAHVTGLASGGALGAVAAWLALPERVSTRGQVALGWLAVALTAGCWAVALAR